MNGKKLRIGLAVLGLVVLGLLALALPGGWNTAAEEGSHAWGPDPTRSNEGAIMFRLTPKGLKDGQFRVDVSVDTHSGDLGKIDLNSHVRLKTNGQTHSPTTAVSLGGHHARGTLTFALDSAPERFEIVIRDVGTVGDLTFRWP